MSMNSKFDEKTGMNDMQESYNNLKTEVQNMTVAMLNWQLRITT